MSEQPLPFAPLGAPDPAWEQVGAEIAFDTAYQELWRPGPRGGSWFTGGRLNLSVNCLDRHLPGRGDQVALYWEGEPGDRRALTYAELHEQVLMLARGLRALGVGPGDHVGLHLGWLPETVAAMLACARVGAVHTVIPTVLPVEALADRLAATRLKVLFTQDGAWRHGTVLPLKARADEALSATESVEHTVVVRRTGMDVPWYEGDRWFHDLVAASRPGSSSAAPDDQPFMVGSDHPLCTVPLANRGGQPVLIVHGTATMLAGALAVHRKLASDGVFWCAGDIAWAVTQFHGIYGPLASGGTAVMYEGTLDIPTHRRAWQIISRYGVETLLTTTSVLRTVRGWARMMPPLEQMPTLRRVITAAEPVEPELAEWLTGTLGEQLLFGDAYGQLELGGIVHVVGLPEPTTGTPQADLDVVDESGASLDPGRRGEAVLRRAWAGTMVDVQGAAASVADRHWTRYPGLYATGDAAVRQQDAEGGEHLHFLGRIDGVVPISGQLVSLREVREVLAEHPYVAATDVVVRKDVALGRSLVAAVQLSPQVGPDPDLDRLASDLMEAVREVMGGLARPRAVLFLDRFGDELSRAARAEAIATLATDDRHEPRIVTWEQVLVAAGHLP